MKKVGVIIFFICGIGLIIGLNNRFTHPGQKLFRDPELGDSQNQYSCSSCHDQGEMIGDIKTKKSFFIVETAFKSVADVIDDAMIPNYLEGHPIGKDSQQMADLVNYLETFSQD